MVFMITAKCGAHSISQFLGRQGASWFCHSPLAVHPLGLYRIQPRALDGQQTHQNAHAFSCPFDLAIVFTDPVAHRMADMPCSIVPNQGQHSDAQSLQLGTTPLQKLIGDAAHRSPVHKTQPGLLLRRLLIPYPAYQQTITSQCLRIWIIFLLHLLHQTQRPVFLRPGTQTRLFKTAPPRFILIPGGPISVLIGQSAQPIPSVFFARIPDRDW
jgi:hypothetical protein